MKAKEIPVGHKQNKLTVVEYLGKIDGTHRYKCECECGNYKVVAKAKILQNRMPKSCGCTKQSACTKYNPGDKYGLLTILEEAPRNELNDKRNVLCVCTCGNKLIVATNNLASGYTKSCGCLRGTHGMSSTRTYNIWEGMLRRCKPENKEMFPYHAGKGIKVCEAWKKSFETFYADMGEAPDNMSLDRIDNNGDYTPSNCRWTTASIQGYNKGLDPNNTSGKAGVSFYQQQGKWSAEIHVDGKHIRLGLFGSFEDAVQARIEGELVYYGWRKEA